MRQVVESETEAYFTVVTGPTAAPLFLDTPRLEELIALRKRRWKLHWLDLWGQTRGRPRKAVIDMRGSWLGYALRASRRHVYRSWRLLPGARPRHKVLQAASVIGRLDRPPAPFLYTSSAREARAMRLVGDGGPVLAVAPASRWPAKTWPPERFAQAAVELLGAAGPLAGGRVLLSGGPRDGPACEAVKSALPPNLVIDLVGLDLLTTYACFKRVRLFIGNDSGLMHLSACSGAPTLGLFGPTDDRVYRPWGARAALVKHPSSSQGAEAPPNAGDGQATSMYELSVATVVRTARDLLDRTQDAGGDQFAAPVPNAHSAQSTSNLTKTAALTLGIPP